MSIYSSKVIILLCLSFLIVLLVATEELAFSQVIDLDKGEEDIRIMGVDFRDLFGSAVSKGDINGDGFDDIIIGAPIFEYPPYGGPGMVYVIFGSASQASTINISNVSADITIYGNDDSCSALGNSVSSGDINNDGYDDIIIGDNWGHSIDSYYVGVVYVIFGSASPASTIDLNNIPADMTIYGDDSGDAMSTSVSSGDINNDGYDDIIIGAPYSDPIGGSDAGEAYIIFGNASPASIIDLNNIPSPANMIIYGDDQSDLLGNRVSIGNINGDNYEDIIISAPCASPMGRECAGEIYVIYGSGKPHRKVDLNSVSPDLIIYGAIADCTTGMVSSGDINSDGYDDIIIGAPDLEPGGVVYVIYGSASLPSIIDLNTVSTDITIYGEAGWFGFSIFSDDINHDKYDDIIIGAPMCSPTEEVKRRRAGKTYIIYGYNAASGTTIDLNTTSADMTIDGDVRWDMSGSSVSCGDVNGDGCNDVIIGARRGVEYGSHINFKAGETYIIYGCSLPIECDFTDTDISEWEGKGKGTAVVKDGQLLLKDSYEFRPFHVFPKCALARNCTIETKVTRTGGIERQMSSSILFSYINERNYWEFKMQLGRSFEKNPGKWILQHKKDGIIVEHHYITADINHDKQYKIHLEIRDKQIKVAVDGDDKINILLTEEKPEKGRIALGYSGPGTCLYDDLYIRKLKK